LAHEYLQTPLISAGYH